MSSNIYKIRLIIGAQKWNVSPQIKLFQEGWLVGASSREMLLNRETSAELGTGHACWLALSSLICTMGVNDRPNDMEVLRGLHQWIQATCLEKALPAKTAHQNWLCWRGQLQWFMGWLHVSVARAHPILTTIGKPSQLSSENRQNGNSYTTLSKTPCQPLSQPLSDLVCLNSKFRFIFFYQIMW